MYIKCLELLQYYKIVSFILNTKHWNIWRQNVQLVKIINRLSTANIQGNNLLYYYNTKIRYLKVKWVEVN